MGRIEGIEDSLSWAVAISHPSARLIPKSQECLRRGTTFWMRRAAEQVSVFFGPSQWRCLGFKHWERVEKVKTGRVATGSVPAISGIVLENKMLILSRNEMCLLSMLSTRAETITKIRNQVFLYTSTKERWGDKPGPQGFTRFLMKASVSMWNPIWSDANSRAKIELWPEENQNPVVAPATCLNTFSWFVQEKWEKTEEQKSTFNSVEHVPNFHHSSLGAVIYRYYTPKIDCS